mmetsp:Transcript_15871/g.33732  ORF Transcript_15871/g.33732 Transcript_15871/m.33732 type:complete len:93 (+) Transcript_15871:280-558(+)
MCSRKYIATTAAILATILGAVTWDGTRLLAAQLNTGWPYGSGCQQDAHSRGKWRREAHVVCEQLDEQGVTRAAGTQPRAPNRFESAPTRKSS